MTRVRSVVAFVVVIVVAVLLTSSIGCADASVTGSCLDDQSCPSGSVCAFGLCVDPAALGAVDVEVEPVVGSGLLTQSVFGVDVLASGRADVTLVSSVNVNGGVVSVEGGGVAATVMAMPERVIAGRQRQPTTITGDGAFSIPLLFGQGYRLQAIPADRDLPPVMRDAVFVAGSDAGADLVMTSLRDVEGRVSEYPVTVRGRVVAGVGVAEQGIPDLEVLVQDGAGRRVSSLGQSDVDGVFVIGLAAAVDDARFVVRPTESNALFPSLEFPLDLGSERVVDLGAVSLGAVTVPVPVAGLVLTASGGPARGAVVSFRGLIGAGVAVAHAICADDGRFSVALHPGSYVVAAVGEQTGTSGMRVSTVEVTASTDDLVLSVPDRLPLALTVVGADGLPVPLASVVLSRIGDENGLAEPVLQLSQPVFLGSADELGRVQLVVDAGRYRIGLQPPRGTGAPAFSTLLTITAGLERDIVLPEASLVAGSLRDGAGEAVSGAFVRVFSSLSDELGQAIFLGEALSESDGTFEVFVPVQ